MGVRDLWSVLEGVGQPVTLSDLQGKTLAIDLSIWIRESDIIGQKVTKPHLRNVFWKVYHLLRNHVTPVAVIEGVPPALKNDELDRRQQAASGTTPRKVAIPAGRGNTPRRGRPGRPRGTQSPRGKNLMFEQQIQECCQLLDALGVCYLQSEGEAEATCAQLNLHGVVDGCITQDGDAFLFGAQTVYRNFTCNAQKVDQMHVYQMADVEKELGLTRKHLIGLALLMGCDYDTGVKSVGKKIAMDFMEEIKGQDPIEKLKEMKTGDFYKKLSTYEHMSKQRHCTKCQHPGTKDTHLKQGCSECKVDSGCTDNGADFVCPCDFHANKRLLTEHSAAMRIRRHILGDLEFPRQKVIDAFLQPAYTKPTCQLDWSKPSVKRFMACNHANLKWGLDKVEARFVPLFTAWDLSHPEETSLLPLRIIKIFYESGQKLIEVEWKYEEDSLRVNHTDVVTTKEFYEGMKDVHPDLVSGYEDEMRRLKLERAKTPNKRKMEKAATMSRKLDDMFPKKKTTIKPTEPKTDTNVSCQFQKKSTPNGAAPGSAPKQKKTSRINLFSQFEEISRNKCEQPIEKQDLEGKSSIPSLMETHTVCEDSPASPDYVGNEFSALKSPIKIAFNESGDDPLDTEVDVVDEANKVNIGELKNDPKVSMNGKSSKSSFRELKKFQGFQEEELCHQLDSDSDSDSFHIDIPPENSAKTPESPAQKKGVLLNGSSNSPKQGKLVLRSKKPQENLVVSAMDTTIITTAPLINQPQSPSKALSQSPSQVKLIPLDKDDTEPTTEVGLQKTEDCPSQNNQLSIVDIGKLDEEASNCQNESSNSPKSNTGADVTKTSSQYSVHVAVKLNPHVEDEMTNCKEENPVEIKEDYEHEEDLSIVDLTHDKSDQAVPDTNSAPMEVTQNLVAATNQSSVDRLQLEEQQKKQLRKVPSPKAKGKGRKKKGKGASLVGQPKISDVFRVKEQTNTNSLKLVLVRNSDS